MHRFFVFALVCVTLSWAQTNTKEITTLVGPTQWSVSSNEPACALQVYIGRINTTLEASSCKRVCVDLNSVSGARILQLRLFSREEAGEWVEGAQPWSAWVQVDSAKGCATYKNWSNNRFREIRLRAIYEISK